MICPHCNKPIPRGKYGTVTEDLKKKALELVKKGYSMRDIEYMLDRKISAPTISRLVNLKNK